METPEAIGQVPMPTFIPIDDPADPRVSGYLDVRERDLVGRQGRFVAEGEVVLRALLSQSRCEVESLFVSDRRVTSLERLLATTSATDRSMWRRRPSWIRPPGFPLTAASWPWAGDRRPPPRPGFSARSR